MRLVSNSVNPNNVVEEERNGDTHYIVKDVPFVRAMDLAGGYVPQNEIKQSTDSWEVPLTANHPRNKPNKPWYRSNVDDNAPISVNTSQAVQREYTVGQAENPSFDGTWINADFAVNADIAQAMGGVAADIVEKIENGEPFDVSSQYIPKPLPEGEYDGAHRANVEGIDEPDSIALLPHKPGQCSRSEGCGVNPQVAANAADIRVPVADDPGESGEDTGEETTMTDDLDLENPDDETKRTLGERMLSALGWGTEGESGGNEPAESGADPTSDMEQRTAELVANHDFDAENLPDEDTQCFDRIYEAVTSNESDDPEEPETETETDETPDMDDNEVVLTEDELEDMIETKAQEIVANREEETEKESLARDIVANSAEYDDVGSVTEDFPTVPALETKRDQVTDSSAMPGSGATANAQTDDLDDLSVGVFE